MNKNLISGRPERPAGSDRLLTTRQVCDLLHVSRSTLHQLRRRGVIEAVRIGRAVRFRARDIKALIEQGEVER